MAFDYDVLIVGGGPAGLATASRLEGLRVRLVHQDREVGLPVRTSGGSYLRDAQALGIPTHLYQRMDRLAVYSDRSLAAFDQMQDPLVVYDITGLYRWLADQAVAAGADVACGVKFLSAEPVGQGIRARLRHRSGAEEQVTARWIVDASGTPRAVLAALKLAPGAQRIGVGVEHVYDIGDTDPHRAVLFMGQAVLGGYGWAFPAPGGELRVGLGVIYPEVEANPRTLMDAFLATDTLARMGITPGALRHVNGGKIPSEPFRDRLVWPGVISVGDSANSATPTVGEGIRQAIADGRALGEAISATLHTGDAKALRVWERGMARQYRRLYRRGFAANMRISGYSALDWDQSVDRLSRASEAEVIALFRSEITLPFVARAALRRIRRRWLG